MAECILCANAMGLALLLAANTAAAADLPKLDAATSKAYAGKCAYSAVHEVGLKGKHYNTISNAKALELDSNGLTIRIDIELINVVSNDNGGWTTTTQTETRTPITCLFAKQKKGKIDHPVVVDETVTLSYAVFQRSHVRLLDRNGKFTEYYENLNCDDPITGLDEAQARYEGRNIITCDEMKRASWEWGYYANLLDDDNG